MDKLTLDDIKKISRIDMLKLALFCGYQVVPLVPDHRSIITLNNIESDIENAYLHTFKRPEINENLYDKLNKDKIVYAYASLASLYTVSVLVTDHREGCTNIMEYYTYTVCHLSSLAYPEGIKEKIEYYNKFERVS